jgi:His-Xaa-Ser system protein HxsD
MEDAPHEEGAKIGSLTTAFPTEVFALEIVKKAAYPFTDRVSFDFTISSSETLVRLDFVPEIDRCTAAVLVADFRNEVLDQDLRRIVAEETAPTRNAILAYAFSRTDLQSE